MRAQTAFFPVLLLLFTCSVSIPAAAGDGSGSPVLLATQGIDANLSNQSLAHGKTVPDYPEKSPTPIDIFHAELDQATLPGPRYMAFGPSIIGISVDPRVLAVCFAVAFIVLVVWFVSFRKRNDEIKDQDGKE